MLSPSLQCPAPRHSFNLPSARPAGRLPEVKLNVRGRQARATRGTVFPRSSSTGTKGSLPKRGLFCGRGRAVARESRAGPRGSCPGLKPPAPPEPITPAINPWAYLTERPQPTYLLRVVDSEKPEAWPLHPTPSICVRNRLVQARTPKTAPFESRASCSVTELASLPVSGHQRSRRTQLVGLRASADPHEAGAVDPTPCNRPAAPRPAIPTSAAPDPSPFALLCACAHMGIA